MSTVTTPKVLIVGAGIGGLTLAAILEKAKIPYEIFEKAAILKPLGSAMTLGAPVMPMLSQLGIADKVIENAVPATSSKIIAEKDMEVVLETDYASDLPEKFGSLSYIISRPKLQGILLDLIPPERIHLNKRVLSHVETGIGIIIRTSDNMTHEGNILVGADGTYSAIRQCLYEQLEKKGQLPSSDKEPLRYSMLCLVGQTRPLEPAGFDFPKERVCIFEATICDKKPYLIVVFTTAEKTICWTVVEFLDKGSSKRDETFRNTEWGPEAAETMCQVIRDFPAGRNVTMGEILDATPKEVICKVMLEEKLFETWTSGRTVLIGDACHKMNPTGGLGAQSAMNDAVVLANYIYSLASIDSKEVEKALKAYKRERYPLAKNALRDSAIVARAIRPGFVGDLMKSVLRNMPRWLWLLANSKALRNRPQIAFLPLAEDKSTSKALPQPSLKVTRGKKNNNDTPFTL
ncbi:hypothetical protein BGZ76_003525 [Entomortierella beljakovae]|nr:hypothetical protein BGZ76_003525 [Entomortierella beljakovae]